MIAVGILLVVAGLAFVIYLRYVWPWTDQEPFENQTKNDLWNYFLPYILGLAILACLVGAAILKKNGYDIGWPSQE